MTSTQSLRLALIIALIVAGCASRRPSPLDGMMASASRGEKTCVRNDVQVRGDECERKTP